MYNQKKRAMLHEGAAIQEREKASDLYTVIANISAKRRGLLRILVWWGG
jgi:hypothetical protein